MPDNTEYENNDQQSPEQPRTLGELLRREREAKRITVETIAKDLKLNAKYVRALEANQYDSLPAEPYVRVYLRSIAKYLLLDSEEILKRFYKEQGLTPHSSHHHTSTKLNVSRVETEKNVHPGIIILIIAGILAALGFIAARQGWLGGPGEAPSEQTTAPADTTDEEASGNDTLPLPDEQQQSDTSATQDTTTTVAPPEEQPQSSANQLDELRLSVRVVGDSAWIQVFTDGESYKNTLPPGSRRTFEAQDSINVHVGNNSAVQFTLNGERIRSLSGSSIAMFKVDNTGTVDQWTLSKWQNVFANRID